MNHKNIWDSIVKDKVWPSLQDKARLFRFHLDGTPKDCERLRYVKRHFPNLLKLYFSRLQTAEILKYMESDVPVEDFPRIDGREPKTRELKSNSSQIGLF